MGSIVQNVQTKLHIIKDLQISNKDTGYKISV